MSIKLRLTLLVSLLLISFLTTYYAVHRLEEREFEQVAGSERRARAQLLTHWVDLASRALPQFVADAAESDEFARQLTVENGSDGADAIARNLARSGVDMVWIVGEDGAPRRAIVAFSAPAAAPAFPVPPTEFNRLVSETPNPRFFALAENLLLEIAVRRLDRAAGAREWLVGARIWNDAHLRGLAELTESEVSVVPASDLAQTPPEDTQLVLLRPLLDWHGHPLRTLRVQYDLSDLNRSVRDAGRQTRLFLLFGVLVIGAVSVALQSWVLKPLAKIGESLARNDPAPAQALSAQRSELGQVAQLVLTTFSQREELQREVQQRAATQQALERSEAELRRTLEERARLGRDLHDGVIQSLYAAGMGLAGIRTQLRPEQTEAAARLEQTRAALNETIHDVRNFIIGLEPEALKLQTFSQAVAALLETMHSLRSFESTVEIDEALASRLTLAQRVHALQITREAVSNALRHGAADRIAVRLHLLGTFAEFEINDNGTGFDPQQTASSGQGLRNLAQRARELGAELSVDSKPGAGARVKLTFSLHHYD